MDCVGLDALHVAHADGKALSDLFLRQAKYESIAQRSIGPVQGTRDWHISAGLELLDCGQQARLQCSGSGASLTSGHPEKQLRGTETRRVKM
jgi:hypothetical protein